MIKLKNDFTLDIATAQSRMARHTFATTVALAHDVPIEVVSRMLGHRDIKTTQIYAKVLRSSVERNAVDKML